MSWVRQEPGGVRLQVKVQPRAARNQIGPVEHDELKVRVTAPPVDDAANEALIKLLAEWLDRPRGTVALVRGKTSRHKTVFLAGLTAAQVACRLQGRE